MAHRRNGSAYWPPQVRLLLRSEAVCHRCGERRPRVGVCATCELIVCEECYGAGLCLDCLEVKRLEREGLA